MRSSLRLLLCAALMGCGVPAGLAQLRTAPSSDQAPSGYVGVSGGMSRYDLRSGSGSFDFDDRDTAIRLYTGVYFHPNLGLEVSYLDMGKAHRIGGDTRARGLGLSLIGRLPLTPQLDLLGRVGSLYGRTRTQGMGGYGVQLGKDSGFGLSYGAGLRWAFTPQWSAVLEWERHRLHFVDRNSDVDTATLGLQYSY